MAQTVTRVQTGVRIEASILNVLKALAALKGMTLGDLLEGVVLHAFEGECAFSPETQAQIRDLKKVYGLKLRAADSHGLIEAPAPRAAKVGVRSRRKS